MNLFRERYSDPKANAQDNLTGRTHYVDSETLRYHKSRILYTHIPANGLLFALVESVALAPNGGGRGFRPVVFDVFGAVVNDRAALDACFSSSDKAVKALSAFLKEFDAKAHTAAAIDARERRFSSDCADMRIKIQSL